MFKRASANYSLWPERARPHRAVPLTFAVGGFAVGLVCTIAAYEVISELVDPAIMQQSVAQSVSGDVLLLAAAVAPTTSQAPALETGRRRPASRPCREGDASDHRIARWRPQFRD